MKECSTCRVEKKYKEFAKDHRNKNGLAAQCKDCKNKDHREYHSNNKDHENYRNKLYYNVRKFDWAEREFIRKYHITKTDFIRILESQGYNCAICGKKTKKLCVDHCHNSGKARGILCYGCNFSLGLLGDDIQSVAKSLIKILKYLKSAEQQI